MYVMANLQEELIASDQLRQEINQPRSISSRVFATLINGVLTDFVIIKYSNRIFITITQCKKIGNLYSVRVNSPQRNGIFPAPGPSVFDIKCVLGEDLEEKTLAVRALVEKIHISQAVLLSLTVSDLSYQSIAAIAEAILENRCW